MSSSFFFFFQAEDGIRDVAVTGVQTCALPISVSLNSSDAQSFRPQAGFDSANGSLPPGDVDMSQIMGLMSAK